VDENSIELHLAGTKKVARRSGGFRELIRYKMSKNSKNMRVFARCYKKSTWAVEGLKKEGFEITKSGDPVELTLHR
jgi:hypothetical protein